MQYTSNIFQFLVYFYYPKGPQQGFGQGCIIYPTHRHNKCISPWLSMYNVRDGYIRKRRGPWPLDGCILAMHANCIKSQHPMQLQYCSRQHYMHSKMHSVLRTGHLGRCSQRYPPTSLLCRHGRRRKHSPSNWCLPIQRAPSSSPAPMGQVFTLLPFFHLAKIAFL